MKAKAIVQSEFGGPETLRYSDTEVAEPGPGEVLVKVTASSINPFDARIREGEALKEFTPPLPYVPGWDVAGDVAAVGDGVDYSVGQRVFGMPRFLTPGAAYAQYRVVTARNLVATPESLSEAEAAALLMAGMTAWQAFHDTVSVSDGAGHFAVQIAAAAGGKVAAIAASAKHDWLRSLGAAETVDYADESAMAALSGFDVALNLAPGSWDETLAAVAQGGDLITISGGAERLDDSAKRAGIHHHITAVNTRDNWLAALLDRVSRGVCAPTSVPPTRSNAPRMRTESSTLDTRPAQLCCRSATSRLGNGPGDRCAGPSAIRRRSVRRR